MSGDASQQKSMRFSVKSGELDFILDDRGGEKSFTKHILVGVIDGEQDSELSITRYYPGRDPYFSSTWEDSDFGSYDAWAIIHRSARYEGRCDYDSVSLGYPRKPGVIAFLGSPKLGKGLAQSTWAPIMMRRALRAVEENCLVIAEYGGGEFNSATGWPTSRGWAMQLGFIGTSPGVVALSRQRFDSLRQIETPYPKFFVNEPRKTTPKEGPVFDGEIFKRSINCDDRYNPQSSYSMKNLEFCSSESIGDSCALREHLLNGLSSNNLELRPADPRGIEVAPGDRALAFTAIGNSLFEVPLRMNESNMKSHPWRASASLIEPQILNWFSFLLANGDIGFALDALTSLLSMRWDRAWDIGRRSASSYVEVPNGFGEGSFGILQADDKILMRVGYAPDGIRPLVIGIGIRMGASPAYLSMNTGTTSTWTKKAAVEHARATKLQQKIKSSKGKTKSK